MVAIHPKTKAARRPHPDVPPGYEPRLWLSVAIAMRKLGANDKQIAEAFGVTLAELNRCREADPDFSAAWNVQPTRDAEVEKALHRRATGYTCERTRVFNYKGTLSIVVYRHHVPANVTAGIFWLINRRPDRWQRNPKPVPVTYNTRMAELTKYWEGTALRPVEHPVASKQGEKDK